MTLAPVDWRDLLAWCGGRVLDVRAAADHAAGHLTGSVSLPLQPDLELVAASERTAWLMTNLPSIFLPPHHESLLVIADRPDVARMVAAHLSDRGRPEVRWLALNEADLAVLPDDLVQRGESGAVLWRPPTFLARWFGLLPPSALGPAFDLGCGSGRAAVWLARRGWRVTGIDHQVEALALGQRLAASCRVAVAWKAADLRDAGSLPDDPLAVALMFRFLDRGLLERAAGMLVAGGVLVLETFRDAPGYLGNPRPRHRLRSGEAAGICRRAGLEVLVHEEGFAADGKPCAGVVARRSSRPDQRTSINLADRCAPSPVIRSR